MKIRVIHGIDDLANDLRHIARTARKDMRDTVLDGIRAGNEVAKGNARTSNPSGSHSWKYPGTFGAEMHRGRGLFGNVISGEYGPRHSGQGMLAPILENGVAGKNAPQNNLARSVDVIGPSFGMEVHRLPDRWFWPR